MPISSINRMSWFYSHFICCCCCCRHECHSIHTNKLLAVPPLTYWEDSHSTRVRCDRKFESHCKSKSYPVHWIPSTLSPNNQDSISNNQERRKVLATNYTIRPDWFSPSCAFNLLFLIFLLLQAQHELWDEWLKGFRERGKVSNGGESLEVSWWGKTFFVIQCWSCNGTLVMIASEHDDLRIGIMKWNFEFSRIFVLNLKMSVEIIFSANCFIILSKTALSQSKSHFSSIFTIFSLVVIEIWGNPLKADVKATFLSKKYNSMKGHHLRGTLGSIFQIISIKTYKFYRKTSASCLVKFELAPNPPRISLVSTPRNASLH